MDDRLFPLLLALRYMHILGAIALMGGTIFARFAVLPAAAELSDSARQDLHQRLRARWSKWVMLAAALLLISGIANLGLASRYSFSGMVSYNMLGGIKFLLALPIFLFASFLTGKTAAAAKFQANARFWLNVNLALALCMVLIGGLMRYTPRKFKDANPSIPAVVSLIQLPSPGAAE